MPILGPAKHIQQAWWSETKQFYELRAFIGFPCSSLNDLRGHMITYTINARKVCRWHPVKWPLGHRLKAKKWNTPTEHRSWFHDRLGYDTSSCASLRKQEQRRPKKTERETLPQKTDQNVQRDLEKAVITWDIFWRELTSYYLYISISSLVRFTVSQVHWPGLD